MAKKWKKALATLLTLSVVLGMLPTAAFAATVTVKDEEDQNNPIEIVFESSSTTLQESDEDQEFTISATAFYDEDNFYHDDVKVDPKDISHWKNEVKVEVSEGLEVDGISSSELRYTKSGNTFKNQDYSQPLKTDLGTITVKVPGGTPSGTYTVSLSGALQLWVASFTAGTYLPTVVYGEYSIMDVTSEEEPVTFTLTIEEAPDVAVESVSLNQEALELTEGETATLTATVLPEEATDKTVTWSSDNTDVATVDENGLVTAVAEGTANITATAGEQSAACAVTVKAEEPEEPEEPKPENNCDFTWKVSPAAVDVSDGEKTVTVTLTGDYTRQGKKADMARDSLLKVWLSVAAPEGFTINKVWNEAGNIEYTDKGSGAYERPNASELHTNEIATITFTVPQGTKSGSYELVLKDIQAHVLFNSQAAGGQVPWMGYELKEAKIPLEVTGEPEEPEEPEKVYVAQVGETQYETLQAAINAAGTGDTVVLLTDCAESVTVAAGQDIILDLKGKTLKNAAAAQDNKVADALREHTITNKGTLTVTGEGTVDNVSHSRAAIYNEAGGNVTLNGGTFDRSAEEGTSILGEDGKWTNSPNGNSWYTVMNFGKMEINDGVTISQGYEKADGSWTGSYSSLLDSGWVEPAKNTAGAEAEIIISGGTFLRGKMSLKNDSFSTMTVKDGNFTDSSNWIVTNYGTLVIEDGTFEGKRSGLYNAISADNRGEMTVKGGSFVYDKALTGIYSGEGCTTAVSGGSFSNEVELGHCAEGFVPVQNGETYGVVDTLTITPNRTSQSGAGAVTLTVAPSNLTAEVEVKCDDETVTLTRSVDGTWTTSRLPNITKVYTFTAKVGDMEATCTVSVSYDAPYVPSRPSTPPEEEIRDEDAPLAEKPFLFEDVAETDWFFESVNYVFQNDLMKGTSESLFSPFMATDRAMIVTMLHRMEEEPGVNFLMTYPDVAEGQWYTEGIRWGTSEKIAKGYGDGSFGPADKVTREQLAAFLYRYAQMKGYDVTGRDDLSGFDDAGDVSGWALEAVQWAVSEGLLKGTGAGLNPLGEASRSETAQVFARFVQAHTQAEAEGETEK